MRSAVVDTGGQPVINLIANPRAVVADATVRERFTNRHLNPSVEVNTTGWNSNDGSVWAAARSTAQFANGTAALSVTRTATNPSSVAASIYGCGVTGAGAVTVTPGETVLASVAVRAATSNRQGTIYLAFRDSAGTIVASNAGVNNNLALTSGTWTTLSTAPVVVPAGAAYVALVATVSSVDASVIATGEVTYFDSGYFGLPGVDYFDGATPASETLTYGWFGTAHASSSYARSAYVETRRNCHPNPAAEAATTLGWNSNNAGLYPVNVENDATRARTGTRCIRSVRTGAASAQIASTYLNTGSLLAWRVTSGQPIRALVYVRPELAGRQARIRYVFRDNAGNTIAGTYNGPQVALPTTGYSAVEYVTTVPAGATSAIAVIDVTTVDASASTDAEQIWYDNALLELNNTVGPYFDGATADADPAVYEWTGTAHASASVQRSKTPANWLASATGSAPYPDAYLGVDADGTPFVRMQADRAGAASLLANAFASTTAYPIGSQFTVITRVRTSRAQNVNARASLVAAPAVALTANTWTWIRATVTSTTARAARAEPLWATAQVGDLIDVSHAMVVEGSYAGDYLDGDSIGWRWKGAAHASESVGYPRPVTELTNLTRDPRAVLPFTDPLSVWSSARWFGGAPATGTYTTVLNATDGPPGIASYKRKTWTVGGGVSNGDTGIEPVVATGRIAVTPGTTVTCGWWVRSSAAAKFPALSGYAYGPDGTPAGSTFAEQRVNGTTLVPSAAVALPAGTWVWLVGSVTIPANRTDIAYWRPTFDIWHATGSVLWATGDTLDMTGAIVVKGDVASLTFADGASPGWQWKGTANASESYGTPDPPHYLRNLVANPRLNTLTGYTGVGTALTTAGEPAGTVKLTADGAASNRQALVIAAPTGRTWDAGTYTISFDAKQGDAKYTSIRVFGYNTVTTVAEAPATVTVTPTADFVPMTATFTVTTAVNRIYIDWRGSNVVAGEVAGRMRRPMLVRGSTAQPYGDGTTPGWRWTSTTDASESVGPPYLLNDIVGPPVLSATTPGGASVPGSVAFATDEDRTMYVVFDVSADTSSNLPTMARLNSTTATQDGSMAIRLLSTGVASTEARVQPLIQPGTTVFATTANSRIAGRHVACAWSESGATLVGYQESANTVQTRPFTGGLTTTTLLQLPAPTTQGDGGVVAYAWRGTHDAATRGRIMAWLARQYGGTVPTGY